MNKKEGPVVVEEFFTVSKKELWGALTEVKQMTQWFFENIEAFEPEIGFKTRFSVQNEEKIFLHLWTIIEVEPLKKIKYNWKYEGYDGDSDVTFKLIEVSEGIKLELTHEVLKDFPQNIIEFKRESCLGGWNYFIKERLKTYLKGDKKNSH